MTKHKIEKDIEFISARKYSRKYPFKEMNVGDSFIIGDYSRNKMRDYSCAARNWATNANIGYKFAVRKIENNKIRIWRIK